ncbi:MAG: aspartate kinase [Burkholderiaceae bacterium]|nr:aspartate kinase [Burkholderiaceae bacterium]
MPKSPAAPIVVKLGGSLAHDPSLRRWLHELAGETTQRFVVVPGGGPFADAVRAAQGIWHFSDEVADALAIAAMDQFGSVLCAIEPRSVPCATRPQIESAWADTRLPVWLPARMMAGDRKLARSWDVTSDTIAAWLASELGAAGLLLIKSCDPGADSGDADFLAAGKVVDPALPAFLARHALAVRAVHKDRWGELAQLTTHFGSRV